MSAGAQTGEVGKTAWLSEGFEELLHRGELDYDVIIVGSGYGGAIAAAELSGCIKTGSKEEVSVCVLERGREYLPGMFPSRLAELPLHVRFSTDTSLQPRGRRDGLFDIRIGPDVGAVLANGLGGGSLINAGVMEKPREAMLRDWPDRVRQDLFEQYYRKAKDLLGAEGRISGHPKGKTAKLVAFERLAPGKVHEASISISLGGERDDDVVRLGVCKRCGDCATGCNHDAKNSLDANLLVRARNAKARLFTGATVVRIERDGGRGWRVLAVHTDESLRKRQGAPAALTARKVVLAAGTFGSTEILLRSQSDALRFSPRLGERFSSNGDSIAAIYNQATTVNAVADETLDPDRRDVGPTITGMLDLRGRWLRRDLVIQEIAIPGPLRRAFEETVTTSKTLHELAEPDRDDHGADGARHDPCAIDAEAMRKTAAFVMMGDDGASGRLELIGGRRADAGDGAIRVNWPDLRHHALFDCQVKTLEGLARRSGPKARVLPNPLWKLLPDAMQFLADDRRGPALTVHPLGGCAMGRDAEDGVVDHLGRVFDVSQPGAGQPLDELVVLDGSIVRNALAINPALTIAALALRAVEQLRSLWGFERQPRVDAPPLPRPRFRPAPPATKVRSTEIAIVERMRGEATLQGKDGREVACMLELTLHFEKRALEGFILPAEPQPPPDVPQPQQVPMARELEVREGRLRVFRKERWDGWRRAGSVEEDLERLAEITAPLTGTLRLLQRERSTHPERRCRAIVAYWRNRGKRDVYQALRWSDPGAARGRRRINLWKRISGALALASRAGEVRQLEYGLRLGADIRHRPRTILDVSDFREREPITGLKRLTYSERSNPWRQLMEVTLGDFPGLRRSQPAVLALDPKYLAEQGVPLLKIAAQNDQVTALADVASLLAYFLRLLLNIHVWSFRKPDAPTERPIERLPGAIAGRLPPPEIDYVYLVGSPPALMRLTRYRPEGAAPVPVVMIHGYSASGTTFAHHAVNPNMAEYFTRRGRDVWIVDMRTSSGMPTATHPWAFEDAAFADIPKAFEEVCARTGQKSVDVFAHCMGAAMFTMAVLAPPDPDAPYFLQRLALPGRVRRAVLSQIAPAVVMSPANVFRGYAMRYLRHFLPLENYQFRVAADAGLTDQLIDRLLATLPYPDHEFEAENPRQASRRTPFVGTRHRMDALYGRDFSLADRDGNVLLDDAVLEHIDDLFGPLSIETVAQAINFARTGLITNQAGRNEYVLPRNVLRYWTFPTMSVHGAENGLADVATLGRFKKKFKEEADIDIEIRAFREFGHQDSLIGRRAEEVFAEVFRFLEGADGRAAR